MSESWTHHRARIAALTRSRSSDDPELLAEKAALAEVRIADFIASAADRLGPLTPEARQRLALLLLAPNRQDGAA